MILHATPPPRPAPLYLVVDAPAFMSAGELSRAARHIYRARRAGSDRTGARLATIELLGHGGATITTAAS